MESDVVTTSPIFSITVGLNFSFAKWGSVDRLGFKNKQKETL